MVAISRDFYLVDPPDHQLESAEAAWIDLVELDAAIAADPAGFEAEIERNEDAQKAAGHWGVPLMVFRGEPFFGQDRIDVLLWRMRRAGLAQRAAPVAAR